VTRWLPGPWTLPAIGGLALAGGRFLVPDLPWSFIAAGWAVVATCAMIAAIRWNRISPALPWILFGGAILASPAVHLAGLAPSGRGRPARFHRVPRRGCRRLIVLARLYATDAGRRPPWGSLPFRLWELVAPLPS
jgi:hypothetical protein